MFLEGRLIKTAGEFVTPNSHFCFRTGKGKTAFGCNINGFNNPSPCPRFIKMYRFLTVYLPSFNIANCRSVYIDKTETSIP